MTHPISPVPEKPTPAMPETFQGLGIADNIMASLERMKFTKPSPIQHRCIPEGIEGKDLIGIAQTGTGKTLAFGIPMIQRLARYKGHGLVLLPTRELALQVDESFQRIGGPIGLRTAVLIGGEPIGKQKRQLFRNPHILIATPGRLIDHLEQGSVKLETVKILVLDEADRMLDMGFAPQINKILLKVPKERQTMLFSATMPVDIVKIATHHMKLPVRIEVAPQGTAATDVEQEIMIVGRDQKKSLLETLLKQYLGTILIFSRTKYGAKKICHGLAASGHKAAEIHSNRSLAQRKEALEGFKRGKYRILVATDIAARGIDVSNIEVVINFDLPDNTDDYVHRIGRTGRAGKKGRAISFATPQETDEIRRIERLIRKPLKVTRPTGLPATTPFARVEEDRPYGHSSASRGSSQGHRAPWKPSGNRGHSSSSSSSGGGWNRKPRSSKKW
ncbi:DEAD/DEAH box helicase [Candidatus Peregrinibacteria bacterium]|nr:DEAD/DEAH box helicase [Candidatus Peregrinibacteria bacterium]